MLNARRNKKKRSDSYFLKQRYINIMMLLPFFSSGCTNHPHNKSIWRTQPSVIYQQQNGTAYCMPKCIIRYLPFLATEKSFIFLNMLILQNTCNFFILEFSFWPEFPLEIDESELVLLLLFVDSY